MNKQFYTDIDELHKLVKPFRVRVTMDRMANCFNAFLNAIAEATKSANEYNKALSRMQHMNIKVEARRKNK
jgi:uncharacterized protein YqgV (UPF0045/DUF77 family)